MLIGIGDRFIRLFKANVNDALNKAEDPEKMLNQIVEDMQVSSNAFLNAYSPIHIRMDVQTDCMCLSSSP